MIKQTAIMVIGAAVLATSAQAGAAAEAGAPVSTQSGIEYELTAGVHSHYVWRGQDQGGGQLVDTSLTASKELNGYTVSANIWYASTGNGGLDEVDFTLAVEKDFGFATLAFGAIYYGFPDDSSGQTTELFLSASRDLFADISGSLTYYKDIDANDDSDGYIELGLSRDLDFFGSFAPTLDVVAGFDVDSEKFTHYQATLSTGYELTESASLSPYVSYSKADSLVDDEFFGGVVLSVSF